MNLRFYDEDEKNYLWRIDYAQTYKKFAQKILTYNYQIDKIDTATPNLPYESLKRIINKVAGESKTIVRLRDTSFRFVNEPGKVYDPRRHLKN